MFRILLYTFYIDVDLIMTVTTTIMDDILFGWSFLFLLIFTFPGHGMDDTQMNSRDKLCLLTLMIQST